MPNHNSLQPAASEKCVLIRCDVRFGSKKVLAPSAEAPDRIFPSAGARIQSANQHFCQFAKPSQNRKRSKRLEQYGSDQDYGHIAYHPAQNPLR